MKNNLKNNFFIASVILFIIGILLFYYTNDIPIIDKTENVLKYYARNNLFPKFDYIRGIWLDFICISIILLLFWLKPKLLKNKKKN